MQRRHGRPVLGAISGLLFGAFVALDLQMFAIWPLDNLSVIGLPLLGLALGILLAMWAPFGRKRAASTDATAAAGQRTASPDTATNSDETA